jgi:hypothetical protein
VGANQHYPSDIAPMLCTGFGFTGASILFLIQACRRRFYGWWTYLVRPILIICCLVAILGGAGALACGSLNTDGEILAIFMIVFSAGAIIAMLFVGGAGNGSGSGTDAAAAADTSRQAPRRQSHQNIVQVWNRRRPRRLRMGVRLFSPFSLLAWPILIAATVLTLASALNLSEAIAAGLPEPRVAADLNKRVFPDYPAWPELLQRLGQSGAVVLSLLGLLALALARRRAGVGHLLRGVIGALMLVGSAAMISRAFHPSVWTEVAELANTHRPTAAVARFTDAFERGPLIACGVMFLMSQIFLSWPPAVRRQNERAEEKGAST